MNKKLLFSPFRSVLLVFLFFTGFQLSVQAQMTVVNNTNCTLIVKVGQRGAGCSACNISPVTAIPPGGVWSHPPAAACGPEIWLGLKFAAIGGGGAGVSYNPIFGGGCGADIATGCNGAIISATWLPAGAIVGPSTVVIQ